MPNHHKTPDYKPRLEVGISDMTRVMTLLWLYNIKSKHREYSICVRNITLKLIRLMLALSTPTISN